MTQGANDDGIGRGLPPSESLDQVVGPNTSQAETLRLLRLCTEERERLSITNVALARSAEAFRRREKKLLRMLRHDSNSGLPNHIVMSRHLRSMLAARELSEDDSPLAVVFVAMDSAYDVLKKTQKSVVCEWVSLTTAHWIIEIIEEKGRLYHTKDGEFTVLLPDIGSRNECVELLLQMSRRVSSAHRFPGNSISVGCHIGCAFFPEHGRTKSEILRNADIALSACRKSGSPFVVYDGEMAERMLERVEINNGMLRALEEQAADNFGGQFELYFQPMVHVSSLDRRGLRYRTLGSECLLRWRHPDWGLIKPSRFIPVAEESGLIVPVGNWVLYRATELMHQWQRIGLGNLLMSINISPVQFKDPMLVDNIERVLRLRRLDPENIQLEITETSMMSDPEQAIEKLERLHDFGVKLSVDDFGTGYSSLSYLKQLAVDTIKIDQSFMKDVASQPQTQGIVRAVIMMARGMGLDVLAEGVETRDQLEFVLAEGCSNVQGYYFAKPMPQRDFVDFLTAAPPS